MKHLSKLRQVIRFLKLPVSVFKNDKFNVYKVLINSNRVENIVQKVFDEYSRTVEIDIFSTRIFLNISKIEAIHHLMLRPIVEFNVVWRSICNDLLTKKKKKKIWGIIFENFK